MLVLKHASSTTTLDHIPCISFFVPQSQYTHDSVRCLVGCQWCWGWWPAAVATTDATRWKYSVVNNTQFADTCQVYVIAACTGVALVPHGHSQFCTSCAETVAAMDSGCPICHSPIQMVLCVCVQLVVTLPTTNNKTLCVLTQTVYILCVFRILFEMQYFEMINCYMKHFWLIPVCCFCLITSDHTFLLVLPCGTMQSSVMPQYVVCLSVTFKYMST